MAAISVKGVSKKYRTFPNGWARVKEALSFGSKEYGRDFWALQDINLEVEPGTILGVVGRNGAGKSTLLDIISGIRKPTSGTVEVNGRLVAISGYGAGFNTELTGRENVMLNGMILGMKRQEILERFDAIVALAEVGEFIDQPLNYYSSGMRSRLGFAIAANVRPDVMLLDETLAVGDAAYKETALQTMYELRDSGTAILFVSHSLSMVETFCTEAILLHRGRVLAAGEPTETIGYYQTLISSTKMREDQQRRANEQPPDHAVVPDEEDPQFERWLARRHSGTGEAKIQSVELLDEHLRLAEEIASGSTVTVRVYLEYLEAVKESNLTIVLRHKKKGWEVLSASTTSEGVPLEGMKKGERVVVDFTFNIPLRDGLYSISAIARAEGEDSHLLHRVSGAATFQITHPEDQTPFKSIVHLPTQIKVHAPERERQDQLA